MTSSLFLVVRSPAIDIRVDQEGRDLQDKLFSHTRGAPKASEVTTAGDPQVPNLRRRASSSLIRGILTFGRCCECLFPCFRSLHHLAFIVGTILVSTQHSGINKLCVFRNPKESFKELKELRRLCREKTLEKQPHEWFTYSRAQPQGTHAHVLTKWHTRESRNWTKG